MAMSEYTWRLSDPGMDLLERAGLAGLLMTLRAANAARKALSPLQWGDVDLTADGVTVHWSGTAKKAFTKLIEWAWQVQDGILYFPAVHDGLDAANWHLRVPMHNGVMRSFLQHVNTQPKLESVTRAIQLDDEKRITVTFEPPATRVEDPDRPINEKTKRLHKKKVPSKRVRPHEDLDKLFDETGGFKSKLVQLSNWVYPGIAGRYGDERSWEGSSHRTLLLMLAPTICLYQRLQGEGNNWVVVVPDVRDLFEFAERRADLHFDPSLIDVASLGDAGLRFVAEFGSRPHRKLIRAGCRVLAMGYVRYYQGQSIRKSVLDVSDRLKSVKRYRILHGVFPNHFQRRKVDAPATDQPKKRGAKTRPADEGPQGNGWYKLPTGRGRIADNLVNNRPWYNELFVPLPWDEDELERQRQFFKTRDNRSYSRETTWFLSMCLQRSKLMKLITEDDMWDAEAEKVFVQVVWETLDSLYAQEAEATKRGGARTTADRFEHLNDDIRRSLMQAKTRPLLRGVLAALFAKAGRQRSISSHTPAVWRLIDDPEQWQKGRDLALVALASHRNKAVREGREKESETDLQTTKQGA
jgi:CRISPR-associated protein Cas8a1/Csx13